MWHESAGMNRNRYRNNGGNRNFDKWKETTCVKMHWKSILFSLIRTAIHMEKLDFISLTLSFREKCKHNQNSFCNGFPGYKRVATTRLSSRATNVLTFAQTQIILQCNAIVQWHKFFTLPKLLPWFSLCCADHEGGWDEWTKSESTSNEQSKTGWKWNDTNNKTKRRNETLSQTETVEQSLQLDMFVFWTKIWFGQKLQQN